MHYRVADGEVPILAFLRIVRYGAVPDSVKNR